MPTLCLEYLWIGGNNELRSETKVETFTAPKPPGEQACISEH